MSPPPSPSTTMALGMGSISMALELEGPSKDLHSLSSHSIAMGGLRGSMWRGNGGGPSHLWQKRTAMEVPPSMNDHTSIVAGTVLE
ncbi:hypothetical protein SLA2020_284370 [Shorea laevis]